MKAKKGKKREGKKHMRIVNEFSAGADLGSREHVIAIEPTLIDEQESYVRTFPTTTNGLNLAVEWLKNNQVETIAMESTGIYWMGFYELLEQSGIEVCLVNARHLKNVAGRKSDVADAVWIQDLHYYGLIRPSFIPKDNYRQLRSYTRQRENLIKEKARSLQHIHKALDMMNIKVQYVLREIDGQVGQQVIRAMISGETDYKKLSLFHNKRLKSTKEEFADSLQGNYQKVHLFTLRQAVDRYDFTNKQIEECDKQIEDLLKQLRNQLEDLPLRKDQQNKINKKRPRKNDYTFDLNKYLIDLNGVNLSAIDGMSDSSVLNLISETGPDFNKWKTSKHFTSWLNLAPRDKISGGKKIGYYPTYSISRASQILRLAAFGLANSNSALGAFYRKVRARKGPKVANKATARKIATIIHKMMIDKVEYVQTSQEKYNQKYINRKLNSIRKQAAKLGYDLTMSAS